MRNSSVVDGTVKPSKGGGLDMECGGLPPLSHGLPHPAAPERINDEIRPRKNE
jgi:hypothetical protein